MTRIKGKAFAVGARGNRDVNITVSTVEEDGRRCYVFSRIPLQMREILSMTEMRFSIVGTTNPHFKIRVYFSKCSGNGKRSKVSSACLIEYALGELPSLPYAVCSVRLSVHSTPHELVERGVLISVQRRGRCKTFRHKRGLLLPPRLKKTVSILYKFERKKDSERHYNKLSLGGSRVLKARGYKRASNPPQSVGGEGEEKL